jgi:hypothetical protein
MRGNNERAATISTVTVENIEQFDAETVARKVQISMQLLLTTAHHESEK